MRRIGPAAAVACLSLLALAACRGDPVRDTSEDVSFTACSDVECAGTLPSGADFDIIMPEDWNGTLAIFSHGLTGPGSAAQSESTAAATPSHTAAPSPAATASRSSSAHSSGGSPAASGTDARSAKPSPTAIEPRPGGPQLAPLWGQGDRSIADVMLQAGYGIAGATPDQPGWSVGAQVTAAEELHEYFVDHVGTPNRVYVWGEATGGLASVRLAESDGDWVSGALAMCAPLSGPVSSYNLALDVAYAVRQLLFPGMKLTGYASEAEAQQYRDRAMRLVRAAAAGSRKDRAKVVFIADIGVLPTHSSTETGTTIDSQIRANVQGIQNLLDQSTVQRYELERLVGGNPSGNAGTDYDLRITTAQREQLDSIAPGTVAPALADLASGERVTADPAAQTNAAAQGEPTGDLPVPLLTLHNVYDSVYVIQNESAYRAQVVAADPDRESNLVNATVFPPSVYSPAVPATEGAGNCTFEPRTLFGALILLNRWVRGGQYPGQDTLAEAFRGQNVTLDYTPPTWPQMSGSPPLSGTAPSTSGATGSAGAAVPRRARALERRASRAAQVRAGGR